MTDAAAEKQDLDALARELDEANASLARLHAEHEALRKKLGKDAPPPTILARAVEKPERSGGAYRGADAETALQAALAKANSAVANLGIENAMLQSRLDARPPASAVWGKLLLVVGILGGVVLLTWVLVAYTDGKNTRLIGSTLAGLVLVLRLLGFKRPSERR